MVGDLTLVIFFFLFYLAKYYDLREYRLSLEYSSLYTYFNTALIPLQFPSELGLSRIVFAIGGHIPFVASLSGKLSSPQPNIQDDLSVSTKRKHRRHFFSEDGSNSVSLLPETDETNVFTEAKERLVKLWLNLNGRSPRSMRIASQVVLKIRSYTRNSMLPTLLLLYLLPLQLCLALLPLQFLK